MIRKLFRRIRGTAKRDDALRYQDTVVAQDEEIRRLRQELSDVQGQLKWEQDVLALWRVRICEFLGIPTSSCLDDVLEELEDALAVNAGAPSPNLPKGWTASSNVMGIHSFIHAKALVTYDKRPTSAWAWMTVAGVSGNSHTAKQAILAATDALLKYPSPARSRP